MSAAQTTRRTSARTRGKKLDLTNKSTAAPNGRSTQNPPKYSRKASTSANTDSAKSPNTITPLKLKIPPISSKRNKPSASPPIEIQTASEDEEEVDELMTSPSSLSEDVKAIRQKSASITPPPNLSKRQINAMIKAEKAEAKALKVLQTARNLLAEGKAKSTPAAELVFDPSESASTCALSSDSEEEILTQQTKRKKWQKDTEPLDDDRKTAKRSKNFEATSVTTPLFRVLIPSPNPDGPSQRRTINPKATFNDLKQLVYEVLECKNVPVKPKLSYLIAGTKGPGISIGSDDDWTCCLQDLASSHLARPKAKQLLPMDLVIVITKQATGSSGKAVASLGHGGKGKKSVKPVLMNLDGSDGDFDIGGDEESNEGMMSEKDKIQLEALKKKLKSCQICGPDVMCKINTQGKHVKVSYNLLRPWVMALVNEDHAFFRVSNFETPLAPTPPNPAPTTTLLPQMPQVNMPAQYFMPMFPPAYQPSAWMNPVNQPPWNDRSYSQEYHHSPGHFHSYASDSPTPGPSRHRYVTDSSQFHPVPSRRHHAPASPSCPVMSSDPPDEIVTSRYDTVRSFLTTLHAGAPHCNLDGFIEVFESQDYWNINEILQLSESKLTSPPFQLTSGNAGFLLAQIRDQVKRTD